LPSSFKSAPPHGAIGLWGGDGADRHGLSGAAFKVEKTHQIGRNRPKRSETPAKSGGAEQHNTPPAPKNDFHDDEIPF
jgi:hypothetical protein